MEIRNFNGDVVKANKAFDKVLVRGRGGLIVDNFPLPFVKGLAEGERTREAVSTAQVIGWVTHSSRIDRDRHYANIGESIELYNKGQMVAKGVMFARDNGKRGINIVKPFDGLDN